MVILVSVVLTVMAVASTVALRGFLDRQLSAQLSSAAERAQVLIDARAAPTISEAQLQAAVPAGAFVICLGAGDRVVANDAPPGLDPRQVVTRVREAGPGAFVPVDTPLGSSRALLIPVEPQRPLILTVGGQNRTVDALVLAFDTSRAERSVRSIALIEVALTMAALGAIVLLLPLALGRVLSPIREMTEAARAVAAGDVGRRLPADVAMAEAAILARAVNDALDARQDAETRLRQFVADASHELRTPLTTIEGWAELHRQGGLAEPQLVDRALNRIGDSAAHLTALVADLSLLARLDAGWPLDRTAVDVRALTEAAAEDIRVIDPTRAVTSTAPPASTPTLVDGDEQRLRQVVLNLTGNALQHTPPGTPITIEVERQGDIVILSVSDAGPGIPPSHQPRVFDRFYQAGGTRSTGGTGLGLAIVRSLVDAHGGTVDLRSGAWGTCFTVVLPAATPARTPAIRSEVDRGAGGATD